MTRMRKPSEAFRSAVAARAVSQMQAAQMVASASNAAVAAESVAQVAGDVAAIDVDTINETLTDLQTRVEALEAPPP